MSEIHYQEVDRYLKNAKKEKFASVYLIYGEEFLYKTVLHKLCENILPSAADKFNYEPIDGTDENLLEAIRKVKTFSLLSGKKVVAICDSNIFYSKKNEEAILLKAKEAYDDDDFKSSAKYLVSLLGLLKLAIDDIRPEKRGKTLKYDSDLLDDDRWLDRIITYCEENSIVPSLKANHGNILQDSIEKGFPSDNHLIITTGFVDKRRGLYRSIKENGIIIDCSVPKGAGREDQNSQRRIINESVKAILVKTGKKIDNTALHILCDKTGFDLRTISNNLEKLISYIGNREEIRKEDIEYLLNRTKKDPLYEFTNAITDRNIDDSIFYMDSLLASGEIKHPLVLLSAIVNQIRKLLLIKSFVASPHGSVWYSACRFPEFKSAVMPAIIEYDKAVSEKYGAWEKMLSGDESDLEFGKGNTKKKGSKKKAGSGKDLKDADLLIAKNPKNAYPVYRMFQKSDKFTLVELFCIFEQLSLANLKFKSTGQDAGLILEEVIFNICLPLQN